MAELVGSPKNWPPLGLPVGSVRALLTLIIVGVVCLNLFRGQEPEVLWIETLLIALAHYFTSRRFVALPVDVVKRLETEGVLENERQPLFLPRHTIRVVILAAFIGLAVYLYREQRLWNNPHALTLLGIIFAYLLGAMFRTVTGWFHRNRTRPPHRFWADARAVIVLLALILVSIPQLIGQPDLIPAEAHPTEVNRIALALVLFYFGSR